MGSRLARRWHRRCHSSDHLHNHDAIKSGSDVKSPLTLKTRTIAMLEIGMGALICAFLARNLRRDKNPTLLKQMS
jgi:hypothetical protein